MNVSYCFTLLSARRKALSSKFKQSSMALSFGLFTNSNLIF